MGENKNETSIRKVKALDDNKLYVKCCYVDGTDKDIDLTNDKSVFDVITRNNANSKMVCFQVHKKRKMIRNGVEVYQSYDFGTPIYLGRRISAYEYYKMFAGALPIGMINEKTRKSVTEQDLLEETYVLLHGGYVVKNPASGFMTLSEALETYQNLDEKQQEEKYKKGL